MCLKDRLDLVHSLREGQFEAVDGACRITYPDEREPLRFVCGELRLAVRPDISRAAWDRIKKASGGELDRGSHHQDALLLRLKVRPGSERFALFNIVFEPELLWVDLKRSRVTVVLDPP